MKVAIVGCGQLAMMMAQAAQRLGHTPVFIAEADEHTQSVEGLGLIVRRADHTEHAGLFKALGEPDVLTYEREQVDIDFLRAFEAYTEVHPSIEAISATQDRILERKTLDESNIPTAKHVICSDTQALSSATRSLTLPLFIKHPRLGYDGKNQWVLKQEDQLDTLGITEQHFPLLVEQAVSFSCEMSIIAARSKKGDVVFYTPTINDHVDGILVKSMTCSDNQQIDLLQPAYQHVSVLLEKWNYVGVLTMELFVTESGVVVNELAPRVHNSGHWSMDGAKASQFENHIRAITGDALGDAQAQAPSGMVNLLGIDALPQALKMNESAYWYKKDVRPRRKMGHLNVIEQSDELLADRLKELVDKLYPGLVSLRKVA